MFWSVCEIIIAIDKYTSLERKRERERECWIEIEREQEYDINRERKSKIDREKHTERIERQRKEEILIVTK